MENLYVFLEEDRHGQGSSFRALCYEAIFKIGSTVLELENVS